KGVFVDILALQQQLANEVSAADVMHEVAEFFIAERVIAEILDHRAAVRIGMGFPDLVFRPARISREQERLDLVSPQQIHDFLVGKNGVRGQSAAARENDENKRGSTGGKQ